MPDVLRAGVIGHPVAHSLSPAIHNAAFRACGIDAHYRPIDAATEGEAEAVMVTVRDEAVLGYNVTMPYKRLAARVADDLSDTARAIGGVNTLVGRGERIRGENTDPDGFVHALERANATVEGGLATVIGTGPTAASAVRALSSLGIRGITVLSREPRDEAFRALHQAAATGWSGGLRLMAVSTASTVLGASSILIDTTPLGMRPDDPPAIDVDALHDGLIVIDAVYGGLEPTALLRACEQRGIAAHDGLGVLVGQAARSFELFTGIAAEDVPVEVMWRAATDELDRRRG